MRQTLAAWMCALLVTAGNAHAESIGVGRVSIEWSALAFSGIPIDFVQGTFFSGSGARVVSSDRSDSKVSTVFAWTDTSASAFASSVVGRRSARAAGIASTSDSEIAASSSQGAAGGGEADTNVDSNREASFIALVAGLLTVSVPFTMSTQIDVQLPGESAGNLLSADVTLFSPTSLTFDDFILFPFLDEVGSSSETIDGTLSTSFFFEAGQQGRFLATTHSGGFATSVPEPNTALLLGCGLACVVTARRRLRRRTTTIP